MGVKGGLSCVFTTCKNISGRSKEKISFFRFPKNKIRCNIWLQACDRKDLIGKTPEDLYKNYRVCEKHFTKQMFLNDLHNRLQPHAVPINANDEDKESTYVNEVTHFQGPSTAIFEEKADNILCVSSSTDNHTQDKTTIEDKIIQTDLKILRSSSENKLLRKKIIVLKKKYQRLQQKKNSSQIQRDTSNIENQTLEHFFNLTDKFLPRNIANFVKLQARLNQQKGKGRKYPTNFKECGVH